MMPTTEYFICLKKVVKNDQGIITEESTGYVDAAEAEALIKTAGDKYYVKKTV